MAAMAEPVEHEGADALLVELLGDPAGRADPYPRYRRLRDEAPVLRSSLGPLVLSRYADCQEVLGDLRFGRGTAQRRDGFGTGAIGALDVDPELRHRFFDQAGHNMLFADPPEHTRLRRLANRAFTPTRVQALRPAVERMVDELLAAAVERQDVELIGEVALPLPIRVIGELVGVPEADRAAFQPLVRATTAGLEPGTDPEALEAALAAMEELGTYFAGLLADRRRRPADDLLSALAVAGEADDRLTEEEIVATAILLFGAGFETTTNLIGNGTLALLEHPDERRRWQQHPSLGPTAVEELLRWDSPVQVNVRTALMDADAGGVPVPRGQSVLVLQGGANRDPARFANPERLDLGRLDNRPLSFGWGIHHCLGAALARMEGEVLFSALLRRCTDMALLDDAPAWRGSLTLRGLDHLHVRLVA